jgi:hypothetical protein
MPLLLLRIPTKGALESKIDALQEELAKFDGLSDIPGVLEA